MEALNDYLEKYESNSEKYTHMIENKKYNIPDEQNTEFLKQYVEIILTKTKINVLEKHKEYGPIYIEINEYDNMNILKIIKIINKIIKKYLYIKSCNMAAYILKLNTKINIIYPYICTKPSLQIVLINELEEASKKLYGKINKHVIYDSDIPMYGSNNSGKLTNIYCTANNKIFETLVPGEKITENFIEYLVQTLSIRKFGTGKFKSNYIAMLNDNIDPNDIDAKIIKIQKSIDTTDKIYEDKQENTNVVSTKVNDKSNLIKFLWQFRVNKGERCTHTSMSGGLWDIPDDTLKIFYELYAIDVKKRELCMTEKHNPEYGPIVIDLDFKFKEKAIVRQIDEKLIKQIVKKITEILKEIFGNDRDYTCFVSQRPAQYKKKDNWCDGLHIQMPFIVCEYMFHFVLRNKFISEFKLEIETVNKLNEIYDDSVIQRNNWCMYLSTKPGIASYQIIDLYNSDMVLNELNTLQLVKILSIRNKTEKQLIKPINYEIINEFINIDIKKEQEVMKKDIEFKPLEIKSNQQYNEKLIRKLLNMLNQNRVDNYYDWIKIGMILHYCSVTDKNNEVDYLNLWDEWSQNSNKYSKNSCARQWKYFKNIKNKYLSLGSLFFYAKQDNTEAYNKMKISEYIQKQQEIFPDNKLMISKIINKGHTCIAELNDKKCPFAGKSHGRNTMYMEVNKLGLCLKCKECPYEMLPIDGHMQLSNNTLRTVFGIGNIYNNITINNNYDPKNILETFAIHESEYNIFEDKTLNELVYLSLNGTGFKLAELIYYLYKDKFNCTASNIWYEYKDHRWRLGAPVLFKLISSDVTKYHVKLIEFYKGLKTKDEDEADHNHNMIAVATGIIKNLETTTFKNNIMQDICSTFYLNNKEFENKLDKKPNLIGFENGIYDLEKYIFREGNHEDCVTMSVGYDYIENYTNHKDDLFTFLEDIQPIELERDYLLKYTSTGLSGENNEEIAIFLSGKTRNGKTKYKDLVAHTLGEYFVTFASNLLTMPRPAPNCPQPELLAFRNKRFALGSEPEVVNGKINTSFFKFFTGNEMIPCRNLYDKKIIEFEPTHKIGILCNNIPVMDDNNDEAVWERTRCIEFPIKFVDNPTKENERKINRNLKQVLPLWKQDFMLLLIEKYKEYKENGLEATISILKFTKSYKDENDVYKQYLDERTEKSDLHVHTSTLYWDFKNWFVQNNPKAKIPSNKIFVAGLRNHIVIEQVKINGKPTTGTKNLQIVDVNEI